MKTNIERLDKKLLQNKDEQYEDTLPIINSK